MILIHSSCKLKLLLIATRILPSVSLVAASLPGSKLLVVVQTRCLFFFLAKVASISISEPEQVPLSGSPNNGRQKTEPTNEVYCFLKVGANVSCVAVFHGDPFVV